MKKIQKCVKRNRKILILASVLTASVIFLPGCDLFTSKQPFPDAYYTSNFIEGIGFDQFAPVPAPGAPVVTGIWDFAYRRATDWDGYDYMSILPAVPALVSSYPPVPSGLSGGAVVNKLEVVNLINSGDFENPADGFSGEGGTWTPSGASAARITTSQLFGVASMNLGALTTGTITYVPVYNIMPAAFLSTNTYKAFFEYSTAFDFLAKAGDGEIPSDNTNSALLPFTGTGTSPSFIFYPPSGHNFTNVKVDNFRLTINAEKKLRLLLKPTETAPELEWGIYSFSVWVHTDPVSFIDKSPYQLNTFTVTMAPGTAGSLSQTSVTYAIAAGWQKLTATLAPGALSFTKGTIDPVLELVLDFNNTKPGSVLLAQPELRFNPDGL